MRQRAFRPTRLIPGCIWILWPLLGSLVPRGRFLDLTLMLTAGVMLMFLARRIRPLFRVTVSRDVRSLTALASGQIATVGMALYVAGVAASRVLLWTTAQKVFAVLVAGSVATSFLASEFELHWLFGQMSDLKAGSKATELPYLP